MQPLNEQAYEHLKQMIASNQLSYNEIYSETKIAKEIGISRTPCRDAIHRLVQEGFIDIIPSKGFQLHRLSETDIHEIFQFRSALEAYCTLQISKEYNTSKAHLLFLKLESIMVKLKVIMDTSHSIEEFCEYDFDFHTLIIDYMENALFTNNFQLFLYRMKRLAMSSLAHENRMEETYTEHLAILESMKTGNVKDVYEVTMLHMERPKGINLEDLQ